VKCNSCDMLQGWSHLSEECSWELCIRVVRAKQREASQLVIDENCSKSTCRSMRT
jgi:hypothetical protein